MLPKHGRIDCSKCYNSDCSYRLIGDPPIPPWKIEKPSYAWGSQNPLVMVLGFSKGANQSKPRPLDEIAFARMRPQLTKIMQALSLLSKTDHVDRRICATEPDFHFGSLVRCSVSMWDNKKAAYAKSGNSILKKFLVCDTTRQVAYKCTETFLSHLPQRTKLVLLLGNEQDYIAGCRRLFEHLYPRTHALNDVAYTDNTVTWVHSIHAAAQGAHVPQWLEGADTVIGRKFMPARLAVQSSGVLQLLRVNK